MDYYAPLKTHASSNPLKRKREEQAKNPNSKPKTSTTDSDSLIMPPSSPLPAPALTSESLRMSYRIGRGEQGVLTFEPYKSLILPFWRFKTVPIATSSCTALREIFNSYVEREDLVGADMARKFVQMGMTRARRYANHKGGKKYSKSEREQLAEGGERVELEKSKGHEGQVEKVQASEIFKKGWDECRLDERYVQLKKEFQSEQKKWDSKHWRPVTPRTETKAFKKELQAKRLRRGMVDPMEVKQENEKEDTDVEAQDEDVKERIQEG